MQSKNLKLPTSKIGLMATYLLKWLFFSTVVGAVVGTFSSFFLIALHWATAYRETHIWVIAFLPLGGLLIGLSYHYYGNTVEKGTNLLIEECHSPKTILPLRMAPLVVFGTLTTHLLGGSAGREGTAVQMGGALADQFTNYFKLNSNDRSILLITGISGGFAAVFGTPIAAAFFAIEVLVFKKKYFKSLFPSLITALIANYVVHLWHVTHTHYPVPITPIMGLTPLFWAGGAGILFGITALVFSKALHMMTAFFKKCKYPPFRPLIGGIVLVGLVCYLGTTKYIGLGIPIIESAFQNELVPYDWAIKLILTVITLGSGFKGGEVTPLFFIGATLGNALFLFIPLPLGLLAAMGFVALFAAATNTPVASAVMGIELFGLECTIYLGIACFFAYLFSGTTGIYTSQETGKTKQLLYTSLKRQFIYKNQSQEKHSNH